MRSVSAGVTAAFASGEVALATLVKIVFPGATVLLNSSGYDLSHNGDTYLASRGLGRVSPITDRPGELPGLKLELLQVDSANIAAALDESDEVQGSSITISTAVISSTTHQIIDVETDWTGYGDTMSIAEDGETAVIGLSGESKGVDLLRGNPLVYNDADQQSRVPGDRYFEYVVSQSDQPVVWPTREWFFK